MFLDHSALKPLIPHLRAYTSKSLSGIQPDAINDITNPLESFSAKVFERVGELENCIESMRIALFYMIDLSKAPGIDINGYIYHYENFIFRLAGILDRSYRLVGVSMQLDQRKFERNNGNAVVAKSLQPNHQTILDYLEDIKALTTKTQNLRNDIAHSSAFSSREVRIVSATSILQLTCDEATEIKSLMVHDFINRSKEMAELIAESIKGVNALLDGLQPVFDDVCQKLQTKKK